MAACGVLQFSAANHPPQQRPILATEHICLRRLKMHSMTPMTSWVSSKNSIWRPLKVINSRNHICLVHRCSTWSTVPLQTSGETLAKSTCVRMLRQQNIEFHTVKSGTTHPLLTYAPKLQRTTFFSKNRAPLFQFQTIPEATPRASHTKSPSGTSGAKARHDKPGEVSFSLPRRERLQIRSRHIYIYIHMNK